MMRGRHVARWLVFLVAGAGCTERGPKARIEGDVQIFDAPADVNVDRLEATLLSGVNALNGVGEDGCPVQLLADFERRIAMVDGEPAARVALRLGFRPLEKGHSACELSAEASGTEAGPLAEAALGAFAGRWRARRAPDRKLLADLGAEEAARWRGAVAEVGRRKLSGAVSLLNERLRSDQTSDEEALDLIEALVQIGDPRAAPALIDATDRQSPLVWPPVLFGLSRLGGRQAEGFLFTVAQGHPNPDLRRRARLALDEIARTEDPAAE